MFADFKKAFKRDESATKIPHAILASMSDNLPLGLKYAQVDKEYCAVVPEEGDISFKFDKLKMNIPTEIQIESQEELLEFAYRTQQIIETDTNIVSINGKQIKMSQFMKNPYKEDFDEDKCKFILKPEPFGEPFPLKIECEEENIAKDFLVKRQPLADMHKSLYKSIDDGGLEITYTIDEEKSNLNFNVHIDILKAERVEEIIEAFKIYKAFIDGKIKVGGLQLNSVPIEKEKVAAMTALEYWKKVQAIADKLNIQFNPKKDIDIEGEQWIDKLYRTLIEIRPYKQSSAIDRFVTTIEMDVDGQNLIEKGAMVFQYTHEENIKLYGVEIQLYSAVALFNCKIEEVVPIQKPVNKYEFRIVPVDEKGISKAAIHFSKKADIKEFYKDPNEVLIKLSQADEL
ncbi:abortive infection system toxin AbiGii family protein [Bacillus cytotoxicus]|uniref:abortive infection system toxin AbiGii family protein n=1 Tax=Bacillus cereus group sp. BfR-BA-01492 TaxID=2920361 RepID=UPI001F5628DD|nr:abortive infection system toxin AbiGii family protein [Bacillus cereus group sp. BfR-BA-01492]EMA6342834.1 abortive phage resistance protein [Bacillus cytotoxicus]